MRRMLVVLLFGSIMTTAAFVTQAQDLSDYVGPCRNNLVVKNSKWHKDGFESVCMLDSMTVKNNSSSNCKDMICSADFYGKSGSRIGRVGFIIYDSIPAGKTKTFRDINVGLMPSPSDQIRAASFQVVSGVSQ